MPLIRSLMTCCVLLVASNAASAQPAKTVGVTMAYPASVGVLWQVSERLAIRPDFTVAWTSTDSSSTAVSTGPFPPIVFETSSEGYTLGFGVSALWTVARWDPLRAYVTPRVGYRRSSATVTTTTTGLPPGVVGGIAPVTERTNTTTGFEVGGSFGAQHSLSERFALFGEVGINYSSLESPADLSPVQSTTIEARSVGIRSGVGVIFFF
jgi:hypothetical protein